jgi:hypothetical protein
VQLDLSRLGSQELKDLALKVKTERERRGRKNPSNHEPPQWPIPNKALLGERQAEP